VYILGISCHYHDAAAALIHDGELVAAADEERFTRIKHDNSYPEHAVEFCLSQARIEGADLDYVVFYEKPLLKFERILMTTLGTFPRSYPVFRNAMVDWFNEKLWIKSRLQTELGVSPDQVLFVEHHLSHAASALFTAPFEKAAILTVDGVGEWTTATVGMGTALWAETDRGRLLGMEESAQEGRGEGIPALAKANQIELTEEARFPHSLGLLYSAFTAFLGFRVNNGEYKVMGMAPYGTPRYVDEVRRLIQVGGDGSFCLNMDYFSFHHSTRRTYNRRFVELFGEPRVPESEFFTHATHPGADHSEWTEAAVARNQKYADIAASIQCVTEDALLAKARYAHARTGCRNLVMAGGVALNSVANGRILRETPFENVYIQPAAGDSGGALGAALYVYHVVLGRPRRFVMEHAYWGAAYDEGEMSAAIEACGLPFERTSGDDVLADRVVEHLLAGSVVGWYRGRFEWGPRALGNRSILADPRRAEMKEIVNTKIKFREPFRPFAPVVVEERAAEYFDTPGLDRHYPPRFMLVVSPVRGEKQDRIPAVCHEGGTGRLQSVRREWNPAYYDVVDKFGQASGVPVLLNTSYNLRGEPIVNTPQDALKTFRESGLDVLAMGPFLVQKA
jgi:carbamoyltransferase